MPAIAVKGGNANPGIAPINSSTHGMSYGEWAGVWWNWALQYPVAQFPILDPDGSLTMQGQSGSVFFLAGAWGTAERWVTIEPGKSIFFPVVNYVDWYPEDMEPAPLPPIPPPTAQDEAFLRTKANDHIDAVTSMVCTVDGKAVNDLWSYRAESPAGGFALDIPYGSCLNEWGYDAGVRDLAITDGIWLMLTPLTPGQHTVHFAATSPTISLDVTYHIYVKAGKK